MAKKNNIAKPEVSAIRPVEQIESLILTIRGKQVMLDRDLARLYGIETKVLNQAVKRNVERFPEDFMFQLTKTSSKIGSRNLRHPYWMMKTYRRKRAPQYSVISPNLVPLKLRKLQEIIYSSSHGLCTLTYQREFLCMRLSPLIGENIDGKGKDKPNERAKSARFYYCVPKTKIV